MRSLTPKLILAFLVVSLIGTALIAIFVGQRTALEFGDFIFDQNRSDFINQFAEYYQQNGSWEGVETIFSFEERLGFEPPFPDERARPIVLVDKSGRVVSPGMGYQVGDTLSQSEFENGVPIQVDGEEVGRWVGIREAFPISRAGKAFLGNINRALLIGAGGATIVALLLAIVLARSLTKPLRELTAATRAVASGDLEQKVPVRSGDELGKLARAFNQMSAELARALDVRRQMTADIAHDLRTPVSVIKGYAAALDEGVMPANTETFHIILDEAERLERLIEDLRTLSLSEAGELSLSRRLASPREIVDRAASAYEHLAQGKNISIEVTVGRDLPDLTADPDRITQVLGHLLDNAMQFTTVEGRIALSAQRVSGGVELRVQDNGPGISAEDLPHVFNRFYRGDKSRGRDDLNSGSGLGLAIAKSIVAGHEGRIWAESPGHRKGSTFTVYLPAAS
jgi:signal transduction histidine kinase